LELELLCSKDETLAAILKEMEVSMPSWSPPSICSVALSLLCEDSQFKDVVVKEGLPAFLMETIAQSMDGKESEEGEDGETEQHKIRNYLISSVVNLTLFRADLQRYFDVPNEKVSVWVGKEQWDSAGSASG